MSFPVPFPLREIQVLWTLRADRPATNDSVLGEVTRRDSPGGPPAGEVAFTSAIASAIRKAGVPVASAALTDMAVAFRGQKLGHGGAIFGALVKVLHKPESDFDPDRLLSALQTRSAEEWGKSVNGLRGGDIRATALQKLIMEAYHKPALGVAAQ